MADNLNSLEALYKRLKGCGGCKARREKIKLQIEKMKFNLGLTGETTPDK